MDWRQNTANSVRHQFARVQPVGLFKGHEAHVKT